MSDVREPNQADHMIGHLDTEDSLKFTLANSEEPDEMPHNMAFHQCLHCLLRQK